jgi:dephospho-CoA kinase
MHGNADPGRAVNLHVRPVGSPGWRFALCFRDWLRDDAAARGEYLAEKRRVAALHRVDKSTAGYAADKEAWFTEHAAAAMEAWVQRTGRQPPQYPAAPAAGGAAAASGPAGGPTAGTAQS